MAILRNPILPGFNPDPSIVRVGEDYYIATSTFEWYPGVQIHHSRDLANWDLVTRPLTRASQLDMRGDPDSCGIWAPCLSHDGEQFWLVYTDVKRKDGSFKDAHNYIVTAPAIEGPWSDPVYVNSSGFDPSLFHDDDGKKWFLNMMWDHRVRPLLFAGIALQEYDPVAKKLVGDRRNIFTGTDLKLVEGPHLYKRNGWYYLLTAEGGTGYEHACTFARSKKIDGPYELHPEKYIITAKDSPLNDVQRSGHGDIVDTPDGRTYVVHLMGRPTTQKRRCVLGRETGIQEAEWRDDGWLWVKGGRVPSIEVDVPGTRDDSGYWAEQRYGFDGALHKDFQWLRTPETDRIFTLEGGKLRLFGRESIGSWFEQALVARRVTHFSWDAEVTIDFAPTDERQFAGITHYYGRYNFHYLTVTAHSDGKRELLIMTSPASFPDGRLVYPGQPIPLPQDGPVRLRIEVRGPQLQFFYAAGGSGGGGNWQPAGPALDASIISDECGGHAEHGSFTGGFVGMACSDLNGTALNADFSDFVYRPVRHECGSVLRMLARPPHRVSLPPAGRQGPGTVPQASKLRLHSPPLSLGAEGEGEEGLANDAKRKREMKIAVTGGTGSWDRGVGPVIIARLRAEGHEVTNLDRAVPGGLERGDFIRVDLTSYGDTFAALHGHDRVVHLAAHGEPDNDHLTGAVRFHGNTMMAYNVFQAACHLGIDRVVWASSETVLGFPFDKVHPAELPVTDDLPAIPTGSYGISKAVTEDLARHMARRFGVTFVGLRFSNIFYDTPGHVTGYDKVESFWSDPLSRRFNLWGYVDARDIAQAVSRSLSAGIGGAENFIIAAADTIMRQPNAELVAAAFPNARLKPGTGEHETLISIEKARAMLGYEPEWSWRRVLGKT